MRNYTGKCEHCGKVFGRHYSIRKRFCDDKCRVAWHRSKKQPDTKAKAAQLERLLMSIKDSINRLEKAAQKAEEFSQDMARPLNERMMLIAMFREKSAIASELKLLLDMNGFGDTLSYDERIAAIYDVDPVNYD